MAPSSTATEGAAFWLNAVKNFQIVLFSQILALDHKSLITAVDFDAQTLGCSL